jgi:hypothetical protein
MVAFTRTPLDMPGSGVSANPSCINPDAYLELSVVSSMALPGTRVTLNIAYHRVGNPTPPSISIARPGDLRPTAQHSL